MTAPFPCPRCGGFDPICHRCVARRLALAQADALDAAVPRTPHRDRLFETWLDETVQDDPAGEASRGGSPAALNAWSVEGEAGELADLPDELPAGGTP